jgi:acyl-coenzyme A thioesterase PaaI-like protein
MQATFVAFRLSPERLQQQLAQFNARREVRWFGFTGSLLQPSTVAITLDALQAGALGGGGTNAVNGGVIAAGFDAAFVLASLAQYDSDVVVTLELSVKFLSLAVASQTPVFTAGVVRSSRRFSFVEGVLASASNPGLPFATASGMVAPAAA